MRNKIVFISLLVFLTVGPALLGQSDTDSVTVTTYFPAPFVVYNEMELYPHTPAITPCNPTTKGTMYFDSFANRLMVCGNTGYEDVSLPSHAVAFFNLPACPPGWHIFLPALGRYIVGRPLGGLIRTTAGTALSNGENRPTGKHTHNEIGVRMTGADRRNGGAGQTLWIATFATGGPNPGSNVPGTNAPYVQLCACERF